MKFLIRTILMTAAIALPNLTPRPVQALDTTSFFDNVVPLVGHSCSFNIYHSGASQETQLNMFRPGLLTSTSAGGNYWLGGVITPWPPGDITASEVGTICGISGITNFVSDGANGTFASDDFVGITFRGTSNADGNTYDYTIGASGATTTVSVNTRVLVPTNTPPTANAGPDQGVASGAAVTLDGSGSNANDAGQSLTYAWSQISGPATALSSMSVAGPTLTAPVLAIGAADAVLVYQLIVNDGFADSPADAVSITVSAPGNTPPTANAGPDQGVASGAAVVLDGSGSNANDAGQSLTYAWSQISGPATALSSMSVAGPTLTAPVLAIGAADAVLVYQLIVNDGFADSPADAVSITVSAPVDITRPSVSLTGSSTSYSAGDALTLTVTFTESVTGFTGSDIALANATLSGFGGSGASYSATLTPTGSTQTIRVNVAAGVATDGSGNTNFAAAELAILPDVAGLSEEAISDAIVARARALINAQPDLRGLLRGGTGAGAMADVTQGAGTFALSTIGDSPVWIYATGQWSTDAGAEQSYGNLSFGGQLYETDRMIIGAMVQFDYSDTALTNGTVTGRGWLVGPYLVGRVSDTRLLYSASLLRGRSDNSLTLTGLSDGEFSTTRTLLTFGLEGRYDAAGGLAVIPSLDLAYIIDEQDSYVDSAANIIPAQTITLGEARFGLGVEMPVDIQNGKLVLTAGLSGIYSNIDRPQEQREAFRARIDLGARAELNANVGLNFNIFYDGIGMDGYESVGAELLLLMRF